MSDPKSSVTVEDLQKELAAVRDLSSRQGEEVNAAKARVAGLEGDLERERTKVTELEAVVAKLEGEVKRLGGEVQSGGQRLHRDLPKGAHEVSESVTCLDYKSQRITPKPNDVVIVVGKDDGEAAKKDVEALQRKLGERHRVFPVTSTQLNELRSLNAVHV